MLPQFYLSPADSAAGQMVQNCNKKIKFIMKNTVYGGKCCDILYYQISAQVWLGHLYHYSNNNKHAVKVIVNRKNS